MNLKLEIPQCRNRAPSNSNSFSHTLITHLRDDPNLSLRSLFFLLMRASAASVPPSAGNNSFRISRPVLVQDLRAT